MLLQIKNLSVAANTPNGEKGILQFVSFDILPKSVFALVGGSGSGKSTTGLAILRLLAPNLKITSGNIFFSGKNLLTLPPEQLRQVRGKEIGFVFQEPLHAFNPVFTVGQQVEEVFSSHTKFGARERKNACMELFQKVGLKEPDRVYQAYPHQLSGGMRQRAMIAQAVALKPKLIIADEPTSSLDVTLQARIIELFAQLKEEFDLSILLITHDLGVVKHVADEVAVMSHGAIVETAKKDEIFGRPQHEYTRGLLNAI